MKKTKFQLGDKVVVIISDFDIPVGTVLTICGFDNRYNYYQTLPYDTSSGSGPENADPWTEEEIELELIYNSPLKKALKENDE